MPGHIWEINKPTEYLVERRFHVYNFSHDTLQRMLSAQVETKQYASLWALQRESSQRVNDTLI